MSVSEGRQQTQRMLLQAITATLQNVYSSDASPTVVKLEDSILIAQVNGEHYLVTVRPVELAYR